MKSYPWYLTIWYSLRCGVFNTARWTWDTYPCWHQQNKTRLGRPITRYRVHRWFVTLAWWIWGWPWFCLEQVAGYYLCAGNALFRWLGRRMLEACDLCLHRSGAMEWMDKHPSEAWEFIPPKPELAPEGYTAIGHWQREGTGFGISSISYKVYVTDGEGNAVTGTTTTTGWTAA